MARYERGDLTTQVAIGTPALEIRAVGDPMYVKELALFANAATASQIGLGRPANGTGAGGTLGLGVAQISDDAAGVCGTVLSGQTTAPTAPTTYLRQGSFAAAIGAGIVWTWPGDGLRVKQGTSLVLWNIAAGSALRTYVVWDE